MDGAFLAGIDLSAWARRGALSGLKSQPPRLNRLSMRPLCSDNRRCCRNAGWYSTFSRQRHYWRNRCQRWRFIYGRTHCGVCNDGYGAVAAACRPRARRRPRPRHIAQWSPPPIRSPEGIHRRGAHGTTQSRTTARRSSCAHRMLKLALFASEVGKTRTNEDECRCAAAGLVDSSLLRGR